MRAKDNSATFQPVRPRRAPAPWLIALLALAALGAARMACSSLVPTDAERAIQEARDRNAAVSHSRLDGLKP